MDPVTNDAATPPASEAHRTSSYDADSLALDLRWWAAANYLTVGQIYLRDNALLRGALRLEHIKPRLLGHWGTSPGLSMIYALLNRVIRETDSDWLYVTGPGHGGPALVAAAWLEGTYSEIYPHVRDDADGVRTLFRQFSSPGGVPSHVSVQTPGSDPRGRRAGLRLGARGRCGVRQPRPDRRVRGRGRRGRDRAAVGVVAAARLPQRAPGRRRAADPAPQRLQDRRAHGARAVLGRGRRGVPAAARAGTPCWSRATTRAQVFPALYAALRDAHDRISSMQGAARTGGSPSAQRRWPAIVLRTPKGWTGPDVVDGVQVQGTFRAHQVPLAGPRRESRAPGGCWRSGCVPTRRRRSSTTPAGWCPS